MNKFSSFASSLFIIVVGIFYVSNYSLMHVNKSTDETSRSTSFEWSGYYIPESIDNASDLVDHLRSASQVNGSTIAKWSKYVTGLLLFGNGSIEEVSSNDWVRLERRLRSVDIDWSVSKISCIQSRFGSYSESEMYDSTYVKCNSDEYVVIKDIDTGLTIYNISKKDGSLLNGEASGRLPGDLADDLEGIETSFNIFKDDYCDSFETQSDIGRVPGFDVVSSPRYESIRSNLPYSNLNVLNKITTLKSIDKVCYYF